LPVSGKLANPTLDLFDRDGVLIASNDNWRSSQQAEISATGIPPTDDLESAIVATLPANPSGLGYTAVMRGVNNTRGVGLVEVYDLDSSVNSKLANISTRGQVQKDDGVLIGGIIVLGSEAERVIVRALGPSLASAGVSGALADPTLELRNGNGDLIAMNENWRDQQQDEIIATGIPPENDLEAAIVATLPAQPSGTGYTAIVRGANETIGVALVEVYALAP
jgi:hypothetical protein